MSFEPTPMNDQLEVDAAVGRVRLAGRPAVVLDASTLGVLTKELVEQAGLEEARALLTRVGYAQGWRLAAPEAAGPFTPGLLGLFRMEPGVPAFLEGNQAGARFLSLDSFEAEQHLAHLGPSRVPACWVICGLASGYLSRRQGRAVEVREERCAAQGAGRCRFQGRIREDWEPAAQLPPGPAAMVAQSPPMRHLLDLAHRIAPVESTVLITGESGTGKERIARLVHGASRRAAGPFIAVNCGAITETLLESELFGHARGAFTGAVADRAGLFESAGGGTILLDEVGEISPAMQVKLLRVLQEREVRRVGENRSRPIDVRVIAATNSDLGADIRQGRFRKDLYYRLSVVELRVPPLRERREDILPLARQLLAEASARLRAPGRVLAPALEEQLLRYPWPGNVRELENAMERTAALADRAVVDALPGDLAPPVAAPPVACPARPLAEVERDYILAVLEANGGNQGITARQLDIGSATLYRKLRAYGRVRPRLTPPPARRPSA